MANEMIERIGKVAWERLFPYAGPWREPGDAEQDRVREVVRECIKVMEEPTRIMINAAAGTVSIRWLDARKCWIVMIKEASK